MNRKYSLAVMVTVCAAGLTVAAGLVAANAAPHVLTGSSTSTYMTETARPISPTFPETSSPQGAKASLSSISNGQAPSDEEAAAFLRSDVAEFPVVDQVFVVRSTISQAQGTIGGNTITLEFAPDDPVLIVTGSGTFHPNGARLDSPLTWGSMIIDATDGGLIGVFGRQGELPSSLRN